jgi:uncharacterized membrane protein
MQSRRKGFVLIAMSVAMLLMLAVLGLAFDFGRIYIARNEGQVFTDAAAMTAVTKLDGTEAGVQKAREAVAKLPIRWNLGTQSFTGVVIEFSDDGDQWDASPRQFAALAYARVTAPNNQVEITFLQAIGGPKSFIVPARSAAAANPVRLIQ